MNKLDLAKLKIYEKIGQIVMPRLDFHESNSLSYAKELIQRFQVGGFIVFGGERKQVKEATKELQGESRIPLFFGCDAERGVGQIVSKGTRFPFTMSLGSAGDEGLVYRQARFIAEEMKECGLNLIFAPIVDVNTNPENPIINVRSYGDDPFLVSSLGAAFIKGCQGEGVMGCAKHFPGHGSVALDSHVTLPSLVRSREDLWKSDLIPFSKAIESGVTSIMIAHIALPDIDSSGAPASISSELIQRLLISDLGFKGLIITDSFRMDALYGLGKEEDIASRSILSGCDIILDPRESVNLVKRLAEMVKIEQIPERLLDSAVEKIIAVKRKWLKAPYYEGFVDETYGKNLLIEIAHRSVCLLKGGRLRSGRAKVYVLDVTEAQEDLSNPFLERLEEAGIECLRKTLTPREAQEFLPENDSGGNAVICLVYTSVAAWTGHTNLPESYKGFLMRVGDLRCEKILISFGSPYIVRGFGGFDTVLCAFDCLEVCQRAVADVLLGRLEAQGRLPVRLYGAGI
jgi:beta-glucosidase-like glycosyl hydrolase